MPARIRLVRMGRRNTPFYRLVVAERGKARNGRFLEVLGTLDPRAKENKFIVKRDRLEDWVKKGATPTPTVTQWLKRLPAA